MTIPTARMARPTRARDWLKYATWRVYTPVHPLVRNVAQYAGLTSAYFVRNDKPGRQPHLIGHLAPGVSAERLIEHLVAQGFGNHFIAWLDKGEVASLRKVENFIYQYHIRIFDDGEVRGHYEYTPECYPIKHLRARGQEARHEVFLGLLKDWITPA